MFPFALTVALAVTPTGPGEEDVEEFDPAAMMQRIEALEAEAVSLRRQVAGLRGMLEESKYSGEEQQKSVTAFSLQHITPVAAVNSLAPILDAGTQSVRFATNSRTNSLFVLAEKPATLESVEALLQVIDVPVTPQRLTVIPVGERRAQNVARFLSKLLPSEMREGIMIYAHEALSDSDLLVRGTPEQIEAVQAVVRLLSELESADDATADVEEGR